MTSGKIPIALAEGDGIGPEILSAVLHILDEAGAPFEYHPIEIGEKAFLSGHPTGISPAAWHTLHSTKALLKAPVTTPQGGGYKSLNVTIRSAFNLYANVRPCQSFAPYIATKHPKTDLVIIRENEEDLYAGIEYRQTPDVAIALKIISRPATENIVRYAFEYARAHNRKKVTCMTKDNILKLSDGLFHQIFEEIAPAYPDIASEHYIIDIGTARLADTPEHFDVLVLPNLYGDILSDVAAQITGSIGLCGSANIGKSYAMFEAVHGSAPKKAGQNSANPTGLLFAALLLLQHFEHYPLAERIHNAWLKTIEMGITTGDITPKDMQPTGTKEFGVAVAKNLGQKPETLKPASFPKPKLTTLVPKTTPPPKRTLIGIDVTLYSQGPPLALQEKLSQLPTPLPLTLLTNRGVQVWPEGHPETFCVDQFRARFTSPTPITPPTLLEILNLLIDNNFDIVRTENLYLFDDKPAF